jgi:hypothetical protein
MHVNYNGTKYVLELGARLVDVRTMPQFWHAFGSPPLFSVPRRNQLSVVHFLAGRRRGADTSRTRPRFHTIVGHESFLTRSTCHKSE